MLKFFLSFLGFTQQETIRYSALFKSNARYWTSDAGVAADYWAPFKYRKRRFLLFGFFFEHYLFRHWLATELHVNSDWLIKNLLKLGYVKLPSASLDTSLEEYVDICLLFFDIPVRKSRIQSLHVLFTLLSEFRNSQHFRNLAENNQIKTVPSTHVTDRLEL